jgi:outer membrane protein OmpA-like peptidoglycan-associated protein
MDVAAEEPAAPSALKRPAEPLPLIAEEKPQTALAELARSLEKDSPSTRPAPIDLPEDSGPVRIPGGADLAGSDDAAGKGSGIPGFSSLDALLDGKEALTPATAPILMPTDLLFEYDSASLRPEAARSLEKLGALIARNAGAVFRIEGHTDSFGGDDYNMQLSIRRAEEVKRWLRETMGIDPSRISTAGFGKTRLLVPAGGSVDAQRINRRVEIVITGAGGA